MSGIEVAGLVLGALPLIISAMEHYEETHKVATSWRWIGRAHRRDLGKLRDCELKFRLNIKILIWPLHRNGTITKQDYDCLLADVEDAGWAKPDLQKALLERLAECRDRYLAILGEMQVVLLKLAKATKVDDDKFQAMLRQRHKVDSESPHEAYQADLLQKRDQSALADAGGGLVASANDHISFEMKRIAYSFTVPRRDALIREIEGYNGTLSAFLQATDRILEHHSPEPTNIRSARRRFRSLLSFRDHADLIFRLIKDAWGCPCAERHCAHLWLRDRTCNSKFQLDMRLKFSQDQMVSNVTGWNDRELSVRLEEQMATQASSISKIKDQQSSPKVTTAALTAAQNPASPVQNGNIKDQGLCSVAHDFQGPGGELLGVLADSGAPCSSYSVFKAGPTISQSTAISLAKLIQEASLLRFERLMLAFVVASSFLQFFSTPWLPEFTNTSDISLLISTESTGIKARQPYIQASFDSSPGLAKDSSFTEFGILLLELCFGKPFADHALWKEQADMAKLVSHAFMRKAIAHEWSRKVPLEAGCDYAAAVDWCLRRATLDSPDWKLEFAQNVLGPLQKCHEAVQLAMTG